VVAAQEAGLELRQRCQGIVGRWYLWGVVTRGRIRGVGESAQVVKWLSKPRWVWEGCEGLLVELYRDDLFFFLRSRAVDGRSFCSM
jgi:hypothetical protein